MKMVKIGVSIGVMAYNEEGNINSLLNALLRQETKQVFIKEIIVVSSGSTDNKQNKRNSKH